MMSLIQKELIEKIKDKTAELNSLVNSPENSINELISIQSEIVDIISEISGINFKKENWEEEIKVMCSLLDCNYSELMLKSRKPQFIKCKYSICFIIKKLKPKMSTTKIGGLLNIHHSTVLYAFKQIIDQPNYFKKEIDILTKNYLS